MAKILDTCAALERFVWQRDDVDHQIDRGIPDQIDVVHACLLGEHPSGLRRAILDSNEPVFATHGKFLEAACGTHIRVLLPEPFDSEHSKVCPRCLDAIAHKGSG